VSYDIHYDAVGRDLDRTILYSQDDARALDHLIYVGCDTRCKVKKSPDVKEKTFECGNGKQTHQLMKVKVQSFQLSQDDDYSPNALDLVCAMYRIWER
jgi:hypothetical protein